MPALTTVELFAGIGGFRLAADSLKIRTLWANDIKPSSAAIYRDRFGAKEHHLGDIRSLLDQVPAHDILSAGFPCQPFSSAGKKQGIRDPRGTLFESIVEILLRKRPRFFVLENVKRLLTMERGEHFATILKSLCEAGYHVEWRLVNAIDFGLPQNRYRVVIAGTRSDLYSPSLKLATPAELGAKEQYPAPCCGTHEPNPKQPLPWRPIESHAASFPNWGLARGDSFTCADLPFFADALPPRPLTGILQTSVPAEFYFTAKTRERIKTSERIDKLVDGVHILYNQGGGARMGYTVFGTGGFTPTLTASASRHYERYQVPDGFRRLTNVEYARLQGFPDDHCRAASVYDQYELFGNAVPPPLAQWALSKVCSTGWPISKFAGASRGQPACV